MVSLKEAGNRVIQVMTKQLEERLAEKDVDFLSQRIQGPYGQLRYKLMQLGFHSMSEEGQGGTLEEHIRAVAQKGREYLDQLKIK